MTVPEGSRDRPVEYRCTVGHDIPRSSLDDDTLEVTLDRGARLRICREHGAPIVQYHRATGPSAPGREL